MTTRCSLGLVVAAILAGVLAWFAAGEIAVTNDGARYLSSAENFWRYGVASNIERARDADGKMVTITHKTPKPLTQFPPGYPVVLALIPGSKLAAAKWLNVVCHALTVLLLGLCLMRLKNRAVAWLGVGAVALSPPLLALQGAALSEPLFAMLVAAFLWAAGKD